MTPRFPFSNRKSADFDTAFRTVRMMHLVFLIALPGYGILGVLLKWFVMKEGVREGGGFVGLPPSTYSVLLFALAVVSVALAIIALYIFPRQNSIQKLKERTSISSVEELGQALGAVHMARMAMANSIGTFGLVLFLLNGQLLHLFAFAGSAFVLMLMLIPNWLEWDAARKQLEYERDGYTL